MEGHLNSGVGSMVAPGQSTQVGCVCAREEGMQKRDWSVEETEARKAK